MNELSLVVDTNFFHECKEIETLNWEALGSFDSINVLVISRVITELDNHKNSPKPRIKRRALKINKILANIIDNQLEPYVIQEKAPRVLLKIEIIAPSRQYNHILDDRVTDDMIIATACALRDKYPERQFCLLSGDLGVAAKALNSEIQLHCEHIPDEWKREEEEDEEQKEIRRLKKEIATYKEREPDIHIFVKKKNDPEKTDKLILSRDAFISLTRDEVSNLAEYLRDKYPIEPKPYYLALNSYRSVIIPKGTYLSNIRITLEEYNDYTEEYNCWFMDTADIFCQLDEKFNKNLSWIGCISIDNQGSIPAENVTMRLTARGKIKIAHYCERNISKNILSKPPSLPFFRVTGVNWDPKIYSAQRNLDNIDYQPDELIEFTCDSLQHQIGAKKLWINIFADDVVDQLDAAIDVEIFAANIPNSIKKTISVQLYQKKCLPLFDKAKQMIDCIRDQE